MNHGVGWPFRLKRRHVAGDTLASRATFFVMGVFFKGSRAGAVRRRWTVTIQTKVVGRLAELCLISRAVRVVTIETGDSAPVHHALHKIVSLHAILVGGSIREVKKICGRPENMIFQLPVVSELPPYAIANRPIVILALNRVREWLSLRMTLDARIAGRDVIHARWTNDIGARRIRDVFAARPVAALAAHIPFGDLLGMDIVADRMAAVA